MGKKEIVAFFTIALLLNFLFAGLIMLGLPYIFKEILSVNNKFYGFTQSVFPAGTVIIGSIILSQLPEIRNYYKVLFYSLNMQSLLLFVIGLPLIPVFVSHCNNENLLLNNFSIIYIWNL